MTRVELEKTDLTAAELAKLAQKEPVILTRKGKPLAAVKDLSGSDWESISLANNQRFLDLIEASRRSYQERGGKTLEEVRQELGLTPKRDRRTRRKRKQV